MIHSIASRNIYNDKVEPELPEHSYGNYLHRKHLKYNINYKNNLTKTEEFYIKVFDILVDYQRTSNMKLRFTK